MFQDSFQHYLPSSDQPDNASIYLSNVIYTYISNLHSFLVWKHHFSLTSAAKLLWKPAGSFSQKYFNCSVLKDTASSTLTFLSLLILPKATRNSSGGWSVASNGFIHGSNLFNPIQDGHFWGCSRMVRGGGQKGCHTHPTMMKFGTIIPYLKNIQKICESRDTYPELSWHQHFFTENEQILLYQKIQI